MKNKSIKELGLRPKPTDMAFDTPILKPETLDLDYSFHVFPDNSVGYLHMHVFEKSLLTKKEFFRASFEMSSLTAKRGSEGVQKFAGLNCILR